MIGWESVDLIRFVCRSLRQCQPRVSTLKCAYNLVIVVGMRCEANSLEIMGWVYFNMVRFDLGRITSQELFK